MIPEPNPENTKPIGIFDSGMQHAGQSSDKRVLNPADILERQLRLIKLAVRELLIYDLLDHALNAPQRGLR